MARPLKREGCTNAAWALLVAWSLVCLTGQAVAQYTAAAKPTLTLVQPAANAVLDAAMVTVSGAYEGADGSELALVSCNGKAGVIFGDRFVVEDVPLKEGSNRLSIVAKDAGGRAVEAAVEVTCDLTAPRIRISEPAQGALLAVFRTRVAGTVADATETSVRVNGQQVAVSDGRFEADVPLREGANAVRVEAVRRTKRVKVGLPVKVAGLDATGNSYEEMSRTIDVSPAAVQLRLRSHVRLRDMLMLTLPLPRDMRPRPTAEYAYTCKGVISRVEEVAGQPGQKSAVVRFVR